MIIIIIVIIIITIAIIVGLLQEAHVKVEEW